MDTNSFFPQLPFQTSKASNKPWRPTGEPLACDIEATSSSSTSSSSSSSCCFNPSFQCGEVQFIITLHKKMFPFHKGMSLCHTNTANRSSASVLFVAGAGADGQTLSILEADKCWGTMASMHRGLRSTVKFHSQGELSTFLWCNYNTNNDDT